jgi:hypothetical protein
LLTDDSSSFFVADEIVGISSVCTVADFGIRCGTACDTGGLRLSKLNFIFYKIDLLL